VSFTRERDSLLNGLFYQGEVRINFVNASDKMYTVNSIRSSFDDVIKGNLHNEQVILVM
jgi:hypothetical protein